MVRIAYVRSRTFGSWLIRAAQWWFPASHCALMTGGDTIIHSVAGRGVVEDSMRSFLDKYQVVDVVEVDADQDRALKFARSVIGSGYDYGAILRMVSKAFGSGKGHRYHCVELVEAALQAGGRRRFRISLDRVTVRQSYQAA